MADILIFPDLHQDLAWAERVLKQELREGMSVIFLGDYFDTPPLDLRTFATAEETARWLMRLKEKLGDQLTLLLGNHDCAYLAPLFDPKRVWATTGPWACPGSSEDNAVAIRQVFGKERDFLKNFRFYHEEADIVFTHAGMDFPHFGKTPAAARATLRTLDDTTAVFIHAPDTVVARCPLSDGTAPRSGLLWNRAVKLPSRTQPGMPQIFGHTAFPRTVRTADSHLCLDGRQTLYGILDTCAKGSPVLTVRTDPADGREVAWAIPTTGFGDAVISSEIRLTPGRSGTWQKA